ncbi:hypothetical protein ASG87_08235 [Frateuria sp. Soil773]|uniref:hypothetical protein n=1 Tax=Frateuria sp. Soil773 TaxID=1736407 RepID=UPI0007006669|nr:hypothetical protein [Frateuria sp. Soil773]KRE88562.1 hypothetical protein ASG87_08235 [Frateuria sp. Soil773]
MRSTTRTLALAIAGVLLAACGHKDKDAPLAFVPADTPYVVANLDVLDDDTRGALLAQADAQLPAQLAQMNTAADQLAAKDPDSARLLRAFAAELNGKSIETFAQNAGLDIKGYSALYGLGLAPVLRFQLADAKAFEGFVGRLETAYGKKFDVATVDGQSYRRHVSAESGTQVVLAVVGKQAVAAVLPADAAQPLLRQALGLDRPAKNLQDDGRLEKLAKAKGYQKWAVGELDLARALPLAASGKDPLFNAMFKAHAEAESAKTGEPVANQLQIPPSCQADAERIASRVPELSFGYTRLEAKHQDMRWDASLASDITQAFAGLKVELPGLGADVQAPFDLAVGLPVAQLRAFWAAQADAVAAKPFACPALSDLNDGFAKLGPAMQKAAIPPFGDLLGARLALDSFDTASAGSLPTFSGRLVLGTSNPAGLLAMGQMMTPALAQLKLAADGKPVALPAGLTAMFKQPAWLAMGAKSLALGIGAGQDAKLAETLKEPTGEAGRMLRMHLNGDMYLSWVDIMQRKADSLAATTAALTGSNDAASGDEAAAALKAATAARKAQFEAMRAQAERIKTLDAEVRVDDKDLIVNSRTELK